MPVRLATRKMWVSTAIAGSRNQVLSTTFAVLRPTPGRLSSAARDDGTSPPNRSARIADSFITCRALLRKSPIVRMCSISRSSPSTSIFCGRVGDLEQRLGRPVDALVGRLRRQRHGDEQRKGVGMRELAPRLGLGGVKAAENLGNRRIVELRGHRPSWHAAPGTRKPRFRRIRVVTAPACDTLAGKQSDETRP